MVWCSNKDNWALSGDVESTSRTYLPKEDACDGTPENERGLVGQVGRERERFDLVRHADGLSSWWKSSDRSESAVGLVQPGRVVGDVHVIRAPSVGRKCARS